MGLVGRLETRHRNEDGFTVSNQPEEFDRFLTSDGTGKALRKAIADENKAKLQYLPEREKKLGSYDAICAHNRIIMNARLKKRSSR